MIASGTPHVVARKIEDSTIILITIMNIKCKELRNQIVYKGVRVHKTDKEKFLSIISCIKSLYSQITLKFSSIEAKQCIEK